jgi:hypothetical protein
LEEAMETPEFTQIRYERRAEGVARTHALALHGIRVEPGGARMIREDAKASKAAKAAAE